MITKQEILQGREKKYPLTDKMEANLLRLLAAVNILRVVYGQPMIVSSGYRPPEINTSVGGKPKSKHMTCEAVDFLDRDGRLTLWCLEHLDVLEQAGLWMEDPRYTASWLHVQVSPPKSGKRVFIP